MIKHIICLTLLLTIALSMEGVVELTDENFKEHVTAEPKFWLVMFSASWVLFYSFSVVIALNSSLKSKRQCLY